MSKTEQKSSWVKKRRSESSRAKSQQRQRRKSGLFKKAAEFSLECESDVVVAIRIRRTGQTYIFDSSSQEEWLEALPRLAVSYPPPIHQTIEDIVPQLGEHSPSSPVA
ncbi:hypothetical protein NUH16_003033 [Penicillium rubens]|uniref:uncharacterized protein n=1 Tax=Penicillium rubens TaxID=1108849 RepID=UPI00238FF792|nr:uncharacterized protein N7525_002883 [Penicillium rubens]KAJ5046208.1 hypothetical protein NUH16_003033 [Penicillium rubens]KAJ5276524.1 hypothetical protein N7524_002677 [Penicillium chrysogenum]KAJ5837695.1 hypothetical protein N7525_002883 [Penicillium rubens]